MGRDQQTSFKVHRGRARRGLTAPGFCRPSPGATRSGQTPGAGRKRRKKNMPAKGQTKPRPVFRCECGDHAFASLTRGFVVLVSLEDEHFLTERPWCAHVNSRGEHSAYATGSINGKKRLLHTVIMPLDGNLQVDHRNRNGCDDRRPNLRPCTDQLNKMNTDRRSRSKSSRFKGVHWNAPTNKWRVRIKVGIKHLNIGCFDIEENAAHAYDAAAREHFGSFACVNFGENGK